MIATLLPITTHTTHPHARRLWRRGRAALLTEPWFHAAVRHVPMHGGEYTGY